MNELRSPAVLVTDRKPWRAPPPVDEVVPVGADGGWSKELAATWIAAGFATRRPEEALSGPVSTDLVRRHFDVCEAHYPTVISRQREALLTPKWSAVMSWLPSALRGAAEILVDVPTHLLGCIEVCSPQNVRLTCLRGRRGQLLSSSAWFLLGELGAKGLSNRSRAARGQLRRSVDVLAYAEVPNHWRGLAPVVARLARQGRTVAFCSAAVGGVRAFVPDTKSAACVLSLDHLALGPRALVRSLGVVAQTHKPAAVVGGISRAAAEALGWRALRCYWVYHKAGAVTQLLEPEVVLFGDASGPRAAAMCDAFRNRGVPSVALQHGHISDVRRYVQASDHFMVWNEASGDAVTRGGYSGGVHVVGNPGLEAEVSSPLCECANRRGVRGVLVAPTATTADQLSRWLALAGDAVFSYDGRTPRVRLHPSMRTEWATREVAKNGMLVSRSASLAQDLLESSMVLTNSPSVHTEALALGVPSHMLTGAGSPTRLFATRSKAAADGPGLAGSSARACQVVSLIGGLSG